MIETWDVQVENISKGDEAIKSYQSCFKTIFMAFNYYKFIAN